MTSGRAGLVDWLEAQIFGAAPFVDVRSRLPEFSDQDAYQARAELVRRRIAGGDSLAGYKVAGSSIAVRQEEHVDGPIVGCIMRSRVMPVGPLRPIAEKMAIEAEIGVLLKKDLVGPGVTLIDAYAAAEALFPAFEMLALRGGPRPSHQARIVASNFAGAFVFGGPPRPLHGIDLRTEGATISVNGEPRGSATAIEVLGQPLNALPLVANTLAASGQSLKAGMVVMTGSILANTAVRPGDCVEASFSTLGCIAMRLSE
jgi:2-oxo-3-hexenedioate decarboxylase